MGAWQSIGIGKLRLGCPSIVLGVVAAVVAAVVLGRTGSHWAGLRDTYSLCAESLDHGQLHANTLTATPPTFVRPAHRRARATKQGPSCATS